MQLHIALLGPLQVLLDGRPITSLSRGKAGALLCFLAVERRRPHAREALAAMFWPDHDTVQARQNLRQLVATLRRLLGDPDEERGILRVERSFLQMDPHACTTDIDGFFDDHPPSDVPAWDERVGAAYRGPFLDAFPSVEGEAWSEWVRHWGERVERRTTEAFNRLIDRRLAQGRFDEAHDVARRLLQLDRWHEETHRRIMRILAMSGDRIAALQHFNDCRDQLVAELGVEPEPATVELYQAIKAGRLQGGGPPPAAVADTIAAPARGSDLHRERRQVTALHAQMLLPSRIDPEEVIVLRRAFQAGCARIVRCGGFIAEQGEGTVLAYFGYPTASEETARDAIDAARALLTAGAAPIRCGVHTGRAVVSGAENAAERIVGVVSQVARALTGHAEPGTVVVSAVSQRLAKGYFRWAPLGRRPLTPLSEQLAVFRVLGASGARTRLQASDVGRLSPFIGRDADVGRVVELWRAARAGHGGTVLLSGDAGIGKSRLIHEVHRALDATADDGGMIWYEHHCQRQHQHTPYHPFVSLLESIIGIDAGGSARERGTALERYLRNAGLGGDGVRGLLADLLGVSDGPARDAPQLVRSRLHQAVVEIIRRGAAWRPTVFVVEDLHWSDASTVDLIGDLLERIADVPLLLLITTRSSLDLAWQHHPAVVRLNLHPLGPADTEALVRTLVEPAVPRAVIDDLVRRSDGIPLFAEGLTDMFVDGRGDRRGSPVPETLDDLLAARLDAIPSGKLAAQIGAVIGDEFSLDLFRNVVRRLPGLDADAAVDGLDDLVVGGLMVRTHAADKEIYRFRHTLVQQAAYRMQLANARRERHAAAAAAHKHTPPQASRVQPAVLAMHYGAAGEAETAIGYWLEATELANRRGATAEARAHIEEALALVDDVPAGVRRIELETDLRLALGTTLIIAKGYSARGGETAFTDALALSEPLGPSERLFSALWGLYCCYNLRWEWPRARRIAFRLMETALRTGRPDLNVKAQYALGSASLWMGDGNVAEECLRMACEQATRTDTDFLDPVDPLLSALCQRGLGAWQRGRPDEAAAFFGLALTKAEASGHPHHIAACLGVTLFYDALRRNYASMSERSGRILAISAAHGFPLWQALGKLARGLASGGEDGLKDVEDGLLEWQRTDSGRLTPLPVFFQALALTRAGRLSAALEALDVGLELIDRTAAFGFEAEFHRLRGECLGGLSDAGGADAARRIARIADLGREAATSL
ncbi:MAG TPA: AAA family ATPase [Azospirillum sp.]|nr:AAA family ATPase [Azospirillum sp.]